MLRHVKAKMNRLPCETDESRLRLPGAETERGQKQGGAFGTHGERTPGTGVVPCCTGDLGKRQVIGTRQKIRYPRLVWAHKGIVYRFLEKEKEDGGVTKT